MFSFFKKKADAPTDAGQLERTIRAHVPGASADDAEVIAAVASLLVHVAFADGEFAADEQARVRDELTHLGSVSAEGAEAIVGAMRAHGQELSGAPAVECAKTVGAKRDRGFRLSVLELLLDLAASHRGTSAEELAAVRDIAAAMGLEPADVDARLPR